MILHKLALILHDFVSFLMIVAYPIGRLMVHKDQELKRSITIAKKDEDYRYVV